MSDTNLAEEPEFDPADFVMAQQRAATQSAITSIDADPEQATRARQIGEATGVPPVVVFGNLENYEQQHKAALTASLLNNNKFLSQYISSDPMAAKISNDDLGQLDQVSSSLGKFSPSTILGKAAQGFKENFDYEGLSREHYELEDMLRNNPLFYNVFIRQAAMAGADVLAGSMRLFSGAVGGAAAGIGESYKQFGGNEAEGNRLTRDLIILAQVGLSGQTGLHGPLPPALHAEIRKFSHAAKPYLMSGEEPPVGVSPFIDELKAHQAKIDINNLEEAIKEASASATRERDPELFANFVRQHTKDYKMGISADAVRKLYGEKEPMADDNLLGWVPNIAEQLRTAEAIGGDIEVPFADWIARVDPELARDLRESIRVRRGGMTLEEAKELGKEEPRPVLATGEAGVDAVRAQASLEPLADVAAEQKLGLERLETTPEGAHKFNIVDVEGKPVGDLRVAEEHGGAQLHIDWVGSKEIGAANQFGPRVMRDLLAQLQQEFPNAVRLVGVRVSGAREMPDRVSIPLKTASEQDIIDLRHYFTQGSGVFEEFGPGIFGQVQPKELYTAHEQEIIAKVDQILARVAPKFVESHPVGGIIHTVGKGKTRRTMTPQGMYIQYSDRLPSILWSLTSEMPEGTARHEAIHHLRNYGFFTPEEWGVLERAARQNDWKTLYNIDKRYGSLDEASKLEESIADAYKYWAKGEKVSPELHPIFEKIKALLSQIRDAIRSVTGKEPTYEELFQKVERGEVGAREPTGPIEEGAFRPKAEEPELPQAGTTRLEDQDIFAKAGAIGMTADQYKRYQRLIEKRTAEDVERQLSRAQEAERKRQTPEWKANSAALREQVSQEIMQRPDIAADEFFRKGTLYGERVPGPIPKIRSRDLTPEQRAAIPESYRGEKGLHPDDAAGLFGYQSGNAMLDKLAGLEGARKESGLKGKPFLDKIIDDETARQMERKYGNLQENILQEAKDQVLTQTQLDLLHEETLALATKAGAEFSFTKEQIAGWVQEEFNKTPIGSISSDKYLSSAGKAGKAAELGLLKEKPTDAFKAKQQQYLAILMANAAKKLEREMDSFDKRAKTYSKRGKPGDLVSGTAQEYTNFIHDILGRVGKPVRRSVQDLADEIKREGYKDLNDFVQSKFNSSWGMDDLPIADFLLDNAWRKPYESLTADEFRAVKMSVDALAKAGKDELKLVAEGRAADRAEVLGKMKEQLKTFPLKPYTATPTLAQKIMSLPRSFLASSTNTETLLNRWDRSDPYGVFNRYVVYPLASAANRKAALQREFAKSYQGIGKVKGEKTLVDSPIIDPLSITDENPQGNPMKNFTMGNVMVMIHNAGNEHNWNTLSRGYNQDPMVLKQWLFANSTKEMWDRAQKMGNDVFRPAFEKAQTVYHNIYGVAPERIELTPFETPFGTYKGWYHPLIKDPIRESYIDAEGKKVSGQSMKQKGGSVYDDSDNFHARTTNGYTKRRTNAVYPVDLNPDMIPIRLSQMLHDIAFRDAIIQAEKIFRDDGLRNEITKHYGAQYTAGLDPYLRGIAGEEGVPSKALGQAKMVSEYLRQNVISAYIGFNIFTALKHGPTAAVMSVREVGAVPFAKAVKDLYARSEYDNMSNRDFVDKWSEEVGRRKRHWQDTISGQHRDIYGKGTVREKTIEAGSWLVAQSDMASVRPTWLAAFRQSMEKTGDFGLSVEVAERAVRRAHGSTALTNQPALVRGGGPIHGWLTSIYGFFGTVMQRRIELAHAINDTYKLGREGDLKAAAKNMPDVLGRTMAHVIWPIIVEEWVTGMTTDDKRGWGSHLLTGTLHGLGASVLYLRDIVHALSTGHDPGVGLISSPLHDVSKLVRDLRHGKQMFSRQHAGQLVGDAVTVFGEATGRAPKEIGNLGRFGIDLMNQQQRPKTPGDWFRGLTRGTMKAREVK